MNDLQRAVHDRKLAEAAVEVAIGQVMVAERIGKEPHLVYDSIRGLVQALNDSSEATRRLATALALDADIFDREQPDLDTLLPPIIEHDEVVIGFTACWAEKDDAHCRKPLNHEGDHAYF